MTLRGTREDWEIMLRRNDEGWGLKDHHVASIRRALDQASPDAPIIDVDAMLPATKQTRERAPEVARMRYIAAHIADSVESWWIHRARVLGLQSIAPVDPWRRHPEHFIRPPMYLHRYGPDPPAEYVAEVERMAAELRDREV